LPLCIVADALYPNQSFFQICKDNKWAWIVTFKDGNLPSVWEEVLGLQEITTDNKRKKKFLSNRKKLRLNLNSWGK